MIFRVSSYTGDTKRQKKTSENTKKIEETSIFSRTHNIAVIAKINQNMADDKMLGEFLEDR